MEYAKISKETYSLLYKTKNSLKDSPLGRPLQVLVELRVSQLNACGFCCKVHLEEAREFGISQEKLDYLPVWNVRPEVYSSKERAALNYAEIITQAPHLVEDQTELSKEILEVFDERELVDLVACISLMNALNRVAIFLKDV